jgi:hypothetical protein
LGNTGVQELLDWMVDVPHFLIQGGRTLQNWNKIRKHLFDEIQRQLEDPDNNFIASYWLLRIYSSIVYARAHDSLAQADLAEVEEQLAKAITLVFSIRDFDENPGNLVQALTPLIPLNPMGEPDEDNYVRYVKNNARQCLLMVSTLYMCVDEGLVPLFRSPNVSLLVDQLFWTSLRGPTKYDILNYPRYCPAVMFFMQGISSLLTLIVAAIVLWSNRYEHPEVDGLEVFLMVLFLSSFLYEYGQYLHSNSIKQYLSSEWNILDLSTNMLLLVWAVFVVSGSNNSRGGKVCLALATIPMSLSLLQFVMINKELGQLVIMILAMIKDVSNFLVVFLFCILGFGIAFKGLYGGLPSSNYSTAWKSFIALFSAAVGGFDFSSFDGSDQAVIGSLLLVVYVTLTAIILLNLLIARMASTHQLIEKDSQAQWSFRKVRVHQLSYFLF